MFATHFATHRIAWSRAVAIVVILLVLFSAPPASLPAWAAELAEMLGYLLLAGAALWRIWCALFIAGNKNGELATSGPYSIVRNPLYLGNFAGVVGFGFAVEQPWLAVALAAAFAVFYPAVVAREESRLAQIFGERYREYCARVPRWIPDWARYQESATLLVSPRHVRGAIFDAMWFLWAFALWEFIEELHKLQLLPTFF
jgi:protein-S-isoprenylcysteine O-methyltransferase Ste14